jgi:MYXO-CTERM domain-containing protein
LMVQSAVLSGTDAGSFAIVSPNVIAQTLADSDSETFLIVMSPHVSGVKQASLDITDSTGTHMIALRGNGVEPPVDRETYYACSTSNGRGAWPIGLALAVMVGRRRRSRARTRTSGYPSGH